MFSSISILLKSKESQRLEFKESFGKETIETVAAFSNSLGGVILIGVYIAVHRNKLLAEAFYLHGDIEKFGTGFFRIRKEMGNSPELQFVFESFNEFTRTGIDITPQVTLQDTPQDTPQDQKLILILEDELSGDAIQEILGLSDREYFRKEHIKPAIEQGLIEMTIPDKPNSKNQKYRLTKTGKQMKEKLENKNTTKLNPKLGN